MSEWAGREGKRLRARGAPVESGWMAELVTTKNHVSRLSLTSHTRTRARVPLVRESIHPAQQVAFHSLSESAPFLVARAWSTITQSTKQGPTATGRTGGGDEQKKRLGEDRRGPQRRPEHMAVQAAPIAAAVQPLPNGKNEVESARPVRWADLESTRAPGHVRATTTDLGRSRWMERAVALGDGTRGRRPVGGL